MDASPLHRKMMPNRKRRGDEVKCCLSNENEQCFSYRVSVETPIVTLGLLEHLPESTLPLAGLFVFFFYPKGNLHHASRNVPVTPQRLNRLIVITRAGSLVEQWTPRIFIFANQLNLLQRILGLPFLDFRSNLANGRLCSHGNRKHSQR